MNKEQRAWWKEAVVYQIYPRSFADSNGDGIGDIEGITAHLEYLAKLGVDVIWLSPVYRSPNDDNGYDISDYQDIMEEFGSMENFDTMLEKAHSLGLKIVMDLVVNHTSDEHAWFMESRKSRDNSYRDYYIWRDARDGAEPNNWGSCFGGSAWKYDAATDQYFLHLFSPKQPDLNWENPRVREEVYRMMNWWCEKGIDGFRMDVISMISKVEGLPDGYKSPDALYGDFGPYVSCGPRVHEFLKEMNREVLSRYDLITVGETGNIPVSEARQFANIDGSELNMIFQFEHVELVPGKVGKWTDKKPPLRDLRSSLNKWQTSLEGIAWNSLFWDNHDQPRVVSRFGCDSEEYRVRSATMLATLLHMMKGTPYIYQGEEIGMTNAHFEDISCYRDIESINAYHQYVGEGVLTHEEMMRYLKEISRDNARTPMQWNASDNAGFTTGTPWIQVNANYKDINVESALADPDSIFYYYQKLIRLRHELDIIVYGIFEPLLTEDDHVYAYRRHLDGRVLTVACNYTNETCDFNLFDQIEGVELISNYKEHEKGKLQPYEARVVLH